MESKAIYEQYFRKQDVKRPYENWGIFLHDCFALWDARLQVLLSTVGIRRELPLKQECAQQIWSFLKLGGGEMEVSSEIRAQIRLMEEHIESRVWG
ncbi:MAG: hypothetical protein LBM69_01790, partial [Lachnospiraceae bacterium]|nr:hypothetical protein [Lachnospiraceae bacterium]